MFYQKPRVCMETSIIFLLMVGTVIENLKLILNSWIINISAKYNIIFIMIEFGSVVNSNNVYKSVKRSEFNKFVA